MNTFTFVKHPVEKLHDFLPDLMPGIEKVISVHKEEGSLKGLLTKKKGKDYSTVTLNLESMTTVLEKFLDEKSPYNWYNKEHLPFDIKDPAAKFTMDIFSELQNVILLIRLPATSLTDKSLAFIYLNENPGNFGATNSLTPLTTENKNIIAFLIRNMLVNHLNEQETNMAFLKTLNQQTRNVIIQAELEKNDFSKDKMSYEMSLVEFCNHNMKEYANFSGKQFTLSTGAIEKIKAYRLELRKLPEIIHKALAYAEALYLDENLKNIELLDWHFKWETERTIAEPETSDNLPGQIYEKTIILLDKLEEAALIVKAEQLKMTGTNVGQAFNQPISAPAISDALFNHKSKINSLIKLYPDRWKTIKSEFRPIRNILKD